MALSFQDMQKPTKMESPTHVQLLVATTLHGPRRVGEWTQAEVDYAYHMSDAFKLGLFDEGIPQRKSVRLWLATLLNCSPMRLSKKIDTEPNLLGKSFFNKNVAALAVMTPEERTYRFNAMEAARIRFMESILESTHFVNAKAIMSYSRPRLARRRPRTPKNTWAAKTVESPRSVSCTDFFVAMDELVDLQDLVDWMGATTLVHDMTMPILVDLHPFNLEVEGESVVGDYTEHRLVDFEKTFEF